jgi:hypothetical protein
MRHMLSLALPEGRFGAIKLQISMWESASIVANLGLLS